MIKHAAVRRAASQAMMRISRKRAWRCIRPLVPVFLAGLGILAIGRAPWGCGQVQRPRLPARPITYLGVPVIRVLISPRPLREVSLATSAGYQLRTDRDVVADSGAPLDRTTVTRSGRDWRLDYLSVSGREISLMAAGESCVSVDRARYRGLVKLLPIGRDQFIIVNYLDLESYLAGVLAKELYPSWSPETYRALAIAARTFAMYHMLTADESDDYDLGSTQAAQVYGGFLAETPKAWQAVRATHGLVLACGAEGDERIFQAHYSACCGGRVNSAEVLRDVEDIEPLHGGQECTDCSHCPRYRWKPVRTAKSDVYRALVGCYEAAGKLKGVRQIRPTGKRVNGRAIWLDVVGPEGNTMRLRAEDLRLALLRAGVPGASKLYSMNCSLRDLGDAIEFHDGRGFGHGVGLCQWGAEAKAANGATAEEILNFYYPGAKILLTY